MRKISSYQKVRHWVGNFLRNQSWQARKSLRGRKEYVDIGCGPNLHDHVINVDYLWRPGVDICWDLRRGIPLPDASMKGVFSEHVLEHFPLDAGFHLLREALRVLRTGGVLRIIVPDAGMYLQRYSARCAGSDEAFPFEELVRFQGSFVPLLSVNGLFYMDREYAYGHCAMYGEQLLRLVLQKAGFVGVERKDFMQGHDPELLLDTPSRRVESLYMEARKDRC